MEFFGEMLMGRLPEDGMDMRLDRINLESERLGQTTTAFVGKVLRPHLDRLDANARNYVLKSSGTE